MKRREFLGVLGGAATWPVAVRAQVRPLVSMLVSGSKDGFAVHVNSFRQRMRQLGYVEGRDLEIVVRYGDGNMASLPSLANEVVRLGPNVIVTTSTAATLAVKHFTTKIPIVSTILTDPVGQGLVSSLNRPGGNVTGILWTLDGLTAKYIELARELLPSAVKIGLLVDSLNPSNAVQQREAEAAVRTLDAQIIILEVRRAEDIEAAFQNMTREGVRVVVVLGSAMFINARVQIATLAAVARIASIYPNRQHVEAGGLISYGVDLLANHQRAADFVDRILKSDKPIELPVEFPPRISLTINLTTAKALGITVPPTLLARADEVIE